MLNDQWEMPNVKVQMPKGKIQMTNDGARATSTKLTDNEHEHATRTLSEGTIVFTNEKHIPMKD